MIPTTAVRLLRQKIHAEMDRAWKFGEMKRSDVYSFMSTGMGCPFHCGDLTTEFEGLRALELVRKLLTRCKTL